LEFINDKWQGITERSAKLFTNLRGVKCLDVLTYLWVGPYAGGKNTGNIKCGKDGKPTVVRKLNGRSCRFVCLKLQELISKLVWKVESFGHRLATSRHLFKWKYHVFTCTLQMLPVVTNGG
jgi:hypothetical protein